MLVLVERDDVTWCRTAKVFFVENVVTKSRSCSHVGLNGGHPFSPFQFLDSIDSSTLRRCCSMDNGHESRDAWYVMFVSYITLYSIVYSIMIKSHIQKNIIYIYTCIHCMYAHFPDAPWMPFAYLLIWSLGPPNGPMKGYQLPDIQKPGWRKLTRKRRECDPRISFVLGGGGVWVVWNIIPEIWVSNIPNNSHIFQAGVTFFNPSFWVSMIFSTVKHHDFQEMIRYSFTETNILVAPEHRPSKKETIVFQPSIFGCYVSFSEGNVCGHVKRRKRWIHVYIYIHTWFSNVLNMFDHLPFLLEDHIVSYADVHSEQINQWNSIFCVFLLPVCSTLFLPFLS